MAIHNVKIVLLPNKNLLVHLACVWHIAAVFAMMIRFLNARIMLIRARAASDAFTALTICATQQFFVAM